MARRKKETPAPITIKLFWAAAVLVVVVMGPLLLMRADWMWAENASGTPQILTSDLESAQDRMRIDLLNERPLVTHVYVPGNRYAALWEQFAQNGWQRTIARGTKGIERSEEEQGVTLDEPTLWFRSRSREGLVARQFVYLEPYARANSTVAWGRFARASAGHAPVRIEPVLDDEKQKAILVGGGSHLTAFVGGTFELPTLLHLVPAPRATARAYAILAPLDPKSVKREMERTASQVINTLPSEPVTEMEVLRVIEDWLAGKV